MNLPFYIPRTFVSLLEKLFWGESDNRLAPFMIMSVWWSKNHNSSSNNSYFLLCVVWGPQWDEGSFCRTKLIQNRSFSMKTDLESQFAVQNDVESVNICRKWYRIGSVTSKQTFNHFSLTLWEWFLLKTHHLVHCDGVQSTIFHDITSKMGHTLQLLTHIFVYTSKIPQNKQEQTSIMVITVHSIDKLTEKLPKITENTK